MDFENVYENFETTDKIEEVKDMNDLMSEFGVEAEDVKEMSDFLSEFENENEKDAHRSLVSFGESVEHRAARSELERDIAAGREIAAENSLKRLAKIEAEEAAKNK